MSDSGGDAEPLSYDGFISYSHAADGLLAPRLQAGLQRFAKPWWKRRALRIFRDEASLSANPHLWESIVAAMDDSEWLVLLLSPEAANSEWVNREIEHWKTHSDVSRILPVITDGAFAWREGEVSGSAAPEALRGVFKGEPRWVDMRFAHSDEHLDLKNPTFLDAVADIASALHGIPKDELASEEVRQHRRAIRTAWAAVVSLVALLVFSTVVALFALDQRAEAIRQAEIAEANAAEARLSAREAAEQRDRALVEASRVEANRLIAASQSALNDDPELAMLLALHAINVTLEDGSRFSATQALRDAMTANRVVERIPIGVGESSVEVSDDGGAAIISSPTDGVRSVNIETGEAIWKFDDGIDFGVVGVGSNGLVAFSVVREGPHREILIVTAATGALEHVVRPGDCPNGTVGHEGFTSDGRWLVVYSGTDRCGDWGYPEEDWVSVVSTDTWLEEYRFDEGKQDRVQFSADGSSVLVEAFGDTWLTQILDFPGLERRFSESNLAWPTASPSFEQLGYEQSDLAFLLDIATGRETPLTIGSDTWLQNHEIGNEPFHFSPDGSQLALITVEGGVLVFGSADGSPVVRLPYSGPTSDAAWAPDGSILVTAHDGEAIVWALDPDPERALRISSHPDPLDLAFDLLSRGFTRAECHRFLIDQCPSVDDLREALH